MLFISFILDFGVGKDVNRWINFGKSNDFMDRSIGHAHFLVYGILAVSMSGLV